MCRWVGGEIGDANFLVEALAPDAFDESGKMFVQNIE